MLSTPLVQASGDKSRHLFHSSQTFVIDKGPLSALLKTGVVQKPLFLGNTDVPLPP